MRRAISLYIARPKAFASETRDCSVRALRVAAGRTYEEAHRLLKAYGRIDRRGAYNSTMDPAARAFGLERVDMPASGLTEKPTLAQFIRAHRTGRYVIRINTHFLALVDGVVHDWANTSGARSRVVKAWGAK